MAAFALTVVAVAVAGLLTAGVGRAAADSYPAPVSVVLSLRLLDPADCTRHTFLVTLGSDAGNPTGTVNLYANGSLQQSQAVPAVGRFMITVSSNQLRAGSNTMTASYVPTGKWKPATASIVITNAAPRTCALPIGVNAGLGGTSGDLDPRILISGTSVLVGAVVVLLYRRSGSAARRL